VLIGSSAPRSAWLVAASFLAAACLNILPLGWLGGYFQPDWVSLVLIYWCIREPERTGAGVGWVSGLLVDLVSGGILGRYALGKTVLGFVSNKLSLRLRVYPVWQQCLGVAALVFLETLVYAVEGLLLGEAPLPLARWMTPLASSILWPLVVVILRPRSRTRGYG
jgi:rod shape-determining protein MreD